MSSRQADSSNIAGEDRTRLIVLGASNVAISFPTVLTIARQQIASPIDVYAAFAHGRSYGLRSSVLAHSYPGIANCGIWQAIGARATSTKAIFTDVGNDILYGASIEQITAWLESCLVKVSDVTDQIVMTELPLESISRVGNLEFFGMRTILFPGCRLSREDTIQRAKKLNENLLQLSKRFEITIRKPKLDWYGIDPIHVRRRHRYEAWQFYLSSLLSKNGTKRGEKASFTERMFIARQTCESRWRFRRPQYTAQPCATLSDQSRLFLF